MDTNQKQFSIGKLLLLALLPGALLVTAYIATLGLRDTIPPFSSFIVLAVFLLMPVLLLTIMRYSKKEYGSYSFKSAFKNHVSMPVGKIILYAIVPAIFAIAVFTLLGPIENQIMRSTMFAKVPEYFYLAHFAESYKNYPNYIIIITMALYLLGNGIFGPIAEELYFRGFLTSHIERFGAWAPVIVSVLFSLYHFFSPWEIVTRIVALLPFAYIAWKKKNIYIGIAVHCFLNTASAIMMILSFLNA